MPQSLSFADQPDRSLAADFLELAAAQGAQILQDPASTFYLDRIPPGLPELYQVVLESRHPQGPLKPPTQFRPPGILQGAGDRLTVTPRDSDIYLAAAFLLDRVEGVALAPDGVFLLDSPYAAGSTARARNFADQFGLIVTLNDDPRLQPKYHLRRPRLAVTEPSPEIIAVLARYNVPYRETPTPRKPEFDTVIATRAAAAEPFRQAGGNVIVVDRAYNLTPPTAKRLLQAIYQGSAYAA